MQEWLGKQSRSELFQAPSFIRLSWYIVYSGNTLKFRTLMKQSVSNPRDLNLASL